MTPRQAGYRVRKALKQAKIPAIVHADTFFDWVNVGVEESKQARVSKFLRGKGFKARIARGRVIVYSF